MLKNHYYSEYELEAGCDEAGRGCLAGSVYAAAVIFPKDYHNDELNDSKQLSAKKRYALREIVERDALAWAVGIVTPEEIDKINILNASILAMHRALDQLKVRPEAVIVDGNKFKPTTYPILLSSKATANTFPSLPLPFSPRHSVTIIWTVLPRNIPNTTGCQTKATPPRNTVKPSGSMA